MEERRDPLYVRGGMGGLVIGGALTGVLVAGPLLAWRLGTVLASPGTPTQPAPPAVSAAPGHLLFPVEGADRTQLRASFDDPRGGRLHRGLDIFAPRYSLVRAADAGIVARLSRSAAGGTAVEQVDGTRGYCFYYAHLDRYADGLREGQTLERGQLIGYVGTSGNAPSGSPHLHFGVFRSDDPAGFPTNDRRGCWSGRAIDPYPLLD